MHVIAARVSENARVGSFDIASVADPIARAIEACGIAIIVLSAILATLRFLRGVYVWKGFGTVYHRYRRDLGRGLVLALEFLVAADIVGTVAVEPTFQNLGVLSLLILIRTFLSFALEVEINGRWPWQADKSGTPKH